MYHVFIELKKPEWKFGRKRNAVGAWAVGEYFHNFFEFSQTFTSASITETQRTCFLYLLENTVTRKEN